MMAQGGRWPARGPGCWGRGSGAAPLPEASGQCSALVTVRSLESHTRLGFPTPRCVTLGMGPDLSESGFLT